MAMAVAWFRLRTSQSGALELTAAASRHSKVLKPTAHAIPASASSSDDTSSSSLDSGSSSGSSGSSAATAFSKRRIGWVGAMYGERPPSGLSLAEAASVATGNFGNAVWGYAAWQLLDHSAVEVLDVTLGQLADGLLAVLMPTANLLFDMRSYGKSGRQLMTQRLHRVATAAAAQAAPVLLVGIGMQVEFDEQLSGEGGATDANNNTSHINATRQASADAAAAQHVRLPREQTQLLAQVHKSGGIVTTRGAFTAAVVAANGLPPPLPLGCPSFMLNHNLELGAVLQRKWDAVLAGRSTSMRLAVTLPATPGSKPLPPHAHLLAKRIFKRFPNSVAVLQTGEDALTLRRLNAKHGTCLGAERIHYFYDPQSWVDGLRSFDFVFGFRIHGTMAALAAEVPGIVVSKDYRIKELAEAMALPSIDLLAAQLNEDTFDLFDFMEAVPAYAENGFDKRRRQVAGVYVREFERHRVPLHPGIAAIGSSG
ncbi:hypothetical protein D9Q98_010380 [Chlorella vulgaris]|uniref:Polysaccharide pyruvyl transferase domain-containing protein n=1 Tax=Chlorella vulgaris TaxID=3077 RepID=A0A9D4TS32_CHLVU|nr:hypothetical protein D9Q98_010380 [Chlorella vulgaris]